MNKFNSLSKDIVSAVELFAEFGQRGHYERKGQVIIQNDVYEPEAEGIFLARCARKIAKRMGTEYAHEWAMKAFVDNVYNRLQTRNKPAPWSRFIMRKDEKELNSYLMSCLPKQA